MPIQYEREEQLELGLTYTEETVRTELSLPVRDCFLRQAGIDEPVSGLNLCSFQQRIGAIAIPSEGIGGVETLPSFRQRGYIRKLMVKVLEGVASRVPVVFLSEGIEELYEKFGFVACVADACLTVPLRIIDRMAHGDTGSASGRIRSFSAADLPDMVALYNRAHAQRPWTHMRHAQWNRLLVTQTWRPGSEVLIYERAGTLAGYAILLEPQYGHVRSDCNVDELTAQDADAAQALLSEIAARCLQWRICEFKIREPLDSVVGRVVQRLGGDYRQSFSASGGMMGAILDRQQLLVLLEPELKRRLPTQELQRAHMASFAALCRGEIIPDNRDLLRLLVGYWSSATAQFYGTIIPAADEQIIDGWFPGGGSVLLPLPYAHRLDHY